MAAAQQFAIDADGVHVAVHAGGRKRIRSVDGRALKMAADLKEGGHDPHIGEQLAELLCLIESAGRDGSGHAVVKRDYQMAGREIDARILLIISSKLSRRRADEEKKKQGLHVFP